METERSSSSLAGRDAIRVQDARFAYPGSGGCELIVLDGLDVAIPYDRSIGLVGLNGSGKTTLLRLLIGELIPQAGEVKVAGSLVSKGGGRVSRPPVGVISQRPNAGLAPTMSVYENYILATNYSKWSIRWAYSGARKAACRNALACAGMGIEDKLDEQVRFLSGGQQQALSVLLALEDRNPVLLMDEPTAALDPFAADRILDLAFTEVERRHGTLVLVSHRVRDIAERCQEILVLADSRIRCRLDNGSRSYTERQVLELMAEGGAA